MTVSHSQPFPLPRVPESRESQNWPIRAVLSMATELASLGVPA